MAIWERIWRANCAVAVFGGHAGTRTHGACKPGCGMGTPLRKATAQKRAPRIFSRGKQTKPGPAPRRGIGGGLCAGRAAAVRRRHPARILVLRWSAQDAAAEPYEYALDCASDRKAYAWPPLPRTPHPRLTRWQRAFYHPFLWRTLCYGKRLCGQGNGKAQALQRGRRERCQSGRAAHKGAARNHGGAQQKRLANAPA